ncbi:hypothetical protein ACLOJK_039398, partial [Asimina triloba]
MKRLEGYYQHRNAESSIGEAPRQSSNLQAAGAASVGEGPLNAERGFHCCWESEAIAQRCERKEHLKERMGRRWRRRQGRVGVINCHAFSIDRGWH